MDEPIPSQDYKLDKRLTMRPPTGATATWRLTMPDQRDVKFGVRIIALLTSSPVQRIDFTLGSIRVDWPGFHLV
jgi:hypothetical protein